MKSEDANAVIGALSRQLLVSSVLRWVLGALFCLGFTATVVLVLRPDAAVADPRAERLWESAWSATMFAGMLWILLTVLSVRQVRSANLASVYISADRADLAESQLIDALRRFSLFRTGKLLACHNLAVIAHHKKRYEIAARLAEAVLSRLRHRALRGMACTTRILLADCRLSLGDCAGAAAVLDPLADRASELSLAEQLLLLPVELRLRLGSGQFDRAVQNIAARVRMAEMLESPKAALAHELLAIACRRLDNLPAAEFLHCRAVLYHDVHELSQEFTLLRDSHVAATSADNN